MHPNTIKNISQIKGLLKALVEAAFPPPYTFLDIGANGGEDSLDLLRHIPYSTIYCFEPDPRAFARLQKRAKMLPDRFKIYNVALGATDGTAIFYQSGGIGEVPREWDKSGSILPPKEHLKHKSVVFNEGIQVPLFTLNTWWSSLRFDVIHLIWMDAQGAEGFIVQAGSDVISRTAFMLVESYQNEMFQGQMVQKDFLTLLGPQWEVIGIHRNDLLLKNSLIRNSPSASRSQ